MFHCPEDGKTTLDQGMLSLVLHERLPSVQIFKKGLMSFLSSVWAEKEVCVCMWEVHCCFPLCANLARPGLNAEE